VRQVPSRAPLRPRAVHTGSDTPHTRRTSWHPPRWGTSPEPARYTGLRDAVTEVAGAPGGAAPRAGLARRVGRDLAGAGFATRRRAGWQPVPGDTWLVTGTLPAAKEVSR
jgi:hypothetical protein